VLVNVYRDNIGRYASKSNCNSFDDVTAQFEQVFAENKVILKNKIKEHRKSAKRIRVEKLNLYKLFVNILTRNTLSFWGKCFKNLLILCFGGLFFFLVFISLKEYEHGVKPEINYQNIKNGAYNFIKTNLLKHFSNNDLKYSQNKSPVSSTSNYIPSKVNELLYTFNAEEYSQDEFDELTQDVQYQYLTQKSRIKVALRQGLENGNMDILNNSLANHNLNLSLVMIGAIESDFDNKKISNSGSACMMQMSKLGAKEVGINNRRQLLENPKACSDAGSSLLAKFSQQFNNDLTLTVASYNIGNTYIKNIRSKNKVINYIDIKRALENKRDIDLAQSSYTKHSQIKNRFAEQVSYLPLFLASLIIADEEGYLTA